ncbi:MAG: undecaprenyldiphospho-muramoylpentapeptide beta-N-acetylglucosaminyltransferase [Firmicutes bacterium]|nr:undecaprenyldiphospho-muramoylpentapeptide beta-N-acetylglucosaminyltransferase [Bacillota bacterium]
MKRIVLTGGGSAGHVTPHLALIPKLEENGWDIHYIGTHTGIERTLMERLVAYYPISAGKLRRYFDLKNFTDPFRVSFGMVQAFFLLRKLRPDVVFSKGGFVSVPVAIAARMLKIPVILHESDFTPGLANKLSIPFASHICVTFPETMKFVPKEKASVTGNPIRKELTMGNRQRGLGFLKFNNKKPVLLAMGGSLGARKINEALRQSLPDLVNEFQIVHLCGKGNLAHELDNVPNYRQFEYINEELPDIYAASDLVISRAGSNAIFELLTLNKPNLLIPLSLEASRGDQIQNAKSFASQGFSHILFEEELTPETLVEKVYRLRDERNQIRLKMQESPLKDSVSEIYAIIERKAEK